jgi:hypothetical protein
MKYETELLALDVKTFLLRERSSERNGDRGKDEEGK